MNPPDPYPSSSECIGEDSDSDMDDTDDATVMGSTVAYAEVEASIQALRYNGGMDGAPGMILLFCCVRTCE
jgi:hypothetical protein